MAQRPTRSARSYNPAGYVEFRRRLVRAREDAGLSQREAADRLGRSQSFVAKCETGERRVDVVELAAFSRVYGAPVDFFIPPTKL